MLWFWLGFVVGFLASDVGRQLRIKMTKGASGAAPSSTANPPVYAYWASGTITARASTTQITWRCDRVLNPVADTNIAGRFDTAVQASKSWRLGAFSDYTGYPKCVEVFEGRVVWANTPSSPRSMFFSRSGLPTDYAPSDADSTVSNDHGFNIDIIAGKVDQILWLRDAPPVKFKAPGGFVMLDRDAFIAISAEIGQHVQAAFNAEGDVSEAIDAETITTKSEIDGFAW